MSNLRLNNRLKSVPIAGGIRELRMLAEEMERNGRDILHFELGEPDFASPVCAKKALVEALNKGNEHYADNAGVKELRFPLAAKLSEKYGYNIDPDHELIVTVGATEALMISMLAFFEPGDEVIGFSPMYPAYDDQCTVAGLSLVNVPCSFSDGFALPSERLKKAITPRTRGIIVNSPCNPTGAVFSEQDIRALADIAKEFDLTVVSDECYQDLVYDGKHLSISEIDGMRERTIVVGAASKTYAMTGWRVGWLVVPADVKRYAQKCHQLLTTHAATFVQHGVVAALASADKDVEMMRAEYRKRRDTAVSLLSSIDGIDVLTPAGAIFIFPRFSKINGTSMDICDFLLNEAGVSTVPASAFRSDEMCVRMSFGCSIEQIKAGAERIATACKKL